MDGFVGRFSKHPKEAASFLSLLFISWVRNIIKLGNQRELNGDDVYPVLDEDEAENLITNLKNTWKTEIKHAKKLGKRPRLWKALLKIFPLKHYVFVITLKITDSFGDLMLAAMLWCYLEVLNKGSHVDQTYGVVFIVGITFASLLKVFASHHFKLHSLLIGMRMKIAVTGMIYRKILKSTRSKLSRVTTGHVMNLVSNDVKRLEELWIKLLTAVDTLYVVPASLLFLCFLIGWQSLLAAVFFLILIVYNLLVSNAYTNLRKKQCIFTDKRLGAINEVISGIRAVKMYAWEWNYRDIIKSSRRDEMKMVTVKNLIESSLVALLFTVRQVASLISICTLVYSGIHLSASNIFTLVAILNVLSLATCIRIPEGLLRLYDAVISTDRFEQFLLERTVNAYAQSRRRTLSEGKIKITLADCIEVKTTNLSVHWRDEDTQCTLRNVNMCATSNQLVILTGAIGSGKSSLLLAILGEIPVIEGSVAVRGQIAYVNQTPWVFTGTVRDNIIFGKNFDEMRYQKVLKACDLEEDLRRFPNSDLSMVGQRGVRLSGGQRSRVSLARAVYSDADIMLLDDPLSAVDPKVGLHIMDKCICGLLSDRLRILATHQLQYLDRADNIIVLKEGRIVNEGTYTDLKNSGLLSEFLKEMEQGKSSLIKGKGKKEGTNVCSATSDGSGVSGDMEEEDEDRAFGTVSWRVYWDYFRAGLPVWVLFVLLLLFLVAQVSLLAPDWWLSRIANMSHDRQKSGVTLGIYAALTGAASILVIARSFLICYGVCRSSENLHDKMVTAVIKSPVLFFDTNPVGRIMNRFSKDTGCMDDRLPVQFNTASALCLALVSVVLYTAVVNFWLNVVIIPLVAGFIYVARYYLKASRQLKRLEAIRCSPIYAHIADTIVGLETIRSSHMEEQYLKQLIRYQNEQTEVNFIVIATGQWVGLNIDLICAIFVTMVAVGSKVIIQDPAVTGMLLALAIGILDLSQFGIRMATKVECQMTSVERVITYTQLPSEPAYSRQAQPPNDWPYEGALMCRDVSIAYLEGGLRVLEGVDVVVNAGEKIGIVGRTGAGKSSLVAALFRMPEPEGQVVIDGVDLGTINIQSARRAIAVITQDPILFGGSLRKNIDPFCCFTDQDIWTVLEEVQLKGSVQELPGKLEYRIEESGSGFSAGERQLLCLARALLQRCKILVMDEATANVDFMTDHLIQQVIRQKLANCTVLTIAHRLNTIIGYDKVMVLDRGQVVEYDDPKVLADKEDGVFSRLLRANNRNFNG